MLKMRKAKLIGASPLCEWCAGYGWVNVNDNPHHSVCPECYSEVACEPDNYIGHDAYTNTDTGDD